MSLTGAIDVRIIRLCLILLLPVLGTINTHAQNELSAYDPKIALNYQEKLFEEREGVRIFDASYAGIEGERVDLYLVVPPGRGRFAGIIFQHGSEQSRLTYLAEAVLLAKAGAVSVIPVVMFPETNPAKLDQFRKDYIKMMFNMRRVVDLLTSREDIDKNRIGYVGHSHGAMIGGVFTAVDKRINTFVLLGSLSRLTDHLRSSSWWQSFREAIPKDKFEEFLTSMKPLDPAEFIGRSAPAQILFQCASYDEVIPRESCQGLYQAAGDPKQIKWYASKHDFQDFDAGIDRIIWLQRTLRLRSLGPILQRKLTER
jgi:cephalosporin-C deacetylase-like acetyl esterase